MRAALVASVAVVVLIGLAAPSQAAVPHGLTVIGSAPELLQVRDGCGLGWHRQGWRDRWGYWRSRCVPNRW